MKEVVRITGALTFTCIICAFLLSLVFGLTKEKIEKNARDKVRAAIIRISPSAEKVKEVAVEGTKIYRLFSKRGPIGYAFLAKGSGYQGKIVILGVIDVRLEKLLGIEVVESVETPGLGAKIMQDKFTAQFKALNASVPIGYVKKAPAKKSQIVAITGATVSSRAVVNILNKRLKSLREQLKRLK